MARQLLQNPSGEGIQLVDANVQNQFQVAPTSGILTLTIDSIQNVIINSLTADLTVRLPTTGVKRGHQCIVLVNEPTTPYRMFVTSGTSVFLASSMAKQRMVFEALVDEPSAVSDWKSFGYSPVSVVGTSFGHPYLLKGEFVQINVAAAFPVGTVYQFGTGGTSDGIAIELKLKVARMSSGSAVFHCLARASNNGLTTKAVSEVNMLISEGTELAVPTVAWNGDTLEVTVTDTSLAVDVEWTTIMRPSTAVSYFVPAVV